MEYLHKDRTEKVISCFYELYNTFGYGFSGKVCETSLYDELKRIGIYCVSQKKIDDYYKDKLVGEYFAELLVEDKVILELKSAESICEEHEFQLINYLKATNIEVACC